MPSKHSDLKILSFKQIFNNMKSLPNYSLPARIIIGVHAVVAIVFVLAQLLALLYAKTHYSKVLVSLLIGLPVLALAAFLSSYPHACMVSGQDGTNCGMYSLLLSIVVLVNLIIGFVMAFSEPGVAPKSKSAAK